MTLCEKCNEKVQAGRKLLKPESGSPPKARASPYRSSAPSDPRPNFDEDFCDQIWGVPSDRVPKIVKQSLALSSA